MTTKSPNFSRYERVAHIMLADAAIRQKLSGKTQAICRPPSNASKEFAIEVIQVTDTIHRAGDDAQCKSRDDILTLAGQMLVTKEVKSAPLFPFEPEAKPEPKEVKVKAAPEPKAVKVKAAPEPKAIKVKAAPEPKAKPEKVKTRSKPEPLPEPDLTAGEFKAVAPYAPADAAKGMVWLREPTDEERESMITVRYVPVPTPPMQTKGCLIFPVGCAAATNMICASQLLTVHGGAAMKKVVEQLDALIAEVQNNTTIPANYAETQKIEQSTGG